MRGFLVFLASSHAQRTELALENASSNPPVLEAEAMTGRSSRPESGLLDEVWRAAGRGCRRPDFSTLIRALNTILRRSPGQLSAAQSESNIAGRNEPGASST